VTDDGQRGQRAMDEGPWTVSVVVELPVLVIGDDPPGA
jgi:hypothetical protein